MPRSWKEYADEEGVEIPPAGAAEFFRQNPDLLAEAKDAKAAGATWKQIGRWLREEHGLQAGSDDSIRRAAI